MKCHPPSSTKGQRKRTKRRSKYSKHIIPFVFFSLCYTWRPVQTHKLTPLHCADSWTNTLNPHIHTSMYTKPNIDKVDRNTTYCQWRGEHQFKRLHGCSVCCPEEPAHTLTHTSMPTLVSPWSSRTLFPFPFSSYALLFYMWKTHTDTLKKLNADDNRGWDWKLKRPPTVRAVYKHELTGYPPTAALWLAWKT